MREADLSRRLLPKTLASLSTLAAVITGQSRSALFNPGPVPSSILDLNGRSLLDTGMKWGCGGFVGLGSVRLIFLSAKSLA